MGSSAGAIKAGQAYVALGVVDGTAKALRNVQRRFQQFGNSLEAIGQKFAGITAIMASPLVIGSKVFADFETQMANVSTMLDEPQKHMDAFKEGIRSMAIEFGEGTDTLSKGLYDILSASIAPEHALTVLAVAAKAAKGGLTDTGVAADAITTILNSYGLAATRATDVSDLLFSIVKRGKTTFAELAPNIGVVASTASQAGVSLEEMGAAIATMTRSGVKTDLAITALKNIITSFLTPASDAAKTAEELGFEMNAATLKSDGLLKIFERIKDLPSDTVARLFPNMSALAGVLPAIKNMQGFSQDVNVMRGRAGAADAAYQKLANTLSTAFSRVKQAIVGAFSAIGEAISGVVRALSEIAIRVIKPIIRWIAANRVLIAVYAVQVALLGSVAVGLLTLGAGMKLAALAIDGLLIPLAAVKVAVLALLAPIGLVVMALTGIGIAFAAYLTSVSGAIDWFKAKIGSLIAFYRAMLADMSEMIARGDIKSAVQTLWYSIELVFYRGIAAVQEAWNRFTGKLAEVIAIAMYTVRDIIARVTQSISTMVTDAVGAIRSLPSWAKKAFGEVLINLGSFVGDAGAIAAGKRMVGNAQIKLDEIALDTAADRDAIASAIGAEREELEEELNRMLEDIRSANYGPNEETLNKIKELETRLKAIKMLSKIKGFGGKIKDFLQEHLPGLFPSAGDNEFSEWMKQLTEGLKKGLLSKPADQTSGTYSARGISGIGQVRTLDRIAQATEEARDHLREIKRRKEAKIT